MYTGWSGSSIYMYYKCLDTASDFGVHSSCHTEDRSLNRSQRTAAKSRTATATAGVVANAFLRNEKGQPNCHLKLNAWSVRSLDMTCDF